MNNGVPHYSLEQFNMMLDGRTARDEAHRMQEHLNACSECRSAYERLVDVDALLHRLPVSKTTPGFTDSVMGRILAAPQSSLAFRLVEKLPHLFGLLIVLSIMIVAFVVTDVFDTTQLDQTKTAAGVIAEKIGLGVATAMASFSGLLAQYLPFAFGQGSMTVAFFVVAIVIMLAVVDRLVGRRLLQK